ncbi:MAG: sporulation protein, partial [Clostridia bacterium]|nr:sporulation protein [Clostridia bacterium]
MRKSIFLAAILSVVIYLLIFPKEAFEASLSGLKLWFYTILPSLLPFLILSDFLIKTDKIPSALKYVENIFQKLLGLTSYGTYAFLMGVFCGYPMGAKLTGDLYREGKISQNEAFYLLSFANNASPMFVTSYVLLN